MDIRYMAASGYDLFQASGGIGGGKGSIEIETGWQLIAAPIQFGYWDNTVHRHVHDGSTVAKFKNYILDQIDDLYGTDQVEIANTFLGDIQAFYSFVPGVTPPTSPHNFQLVYLDGENEEISGFWIRSLSGSSMTITWGE